VEFGFPEVENMHLPTQCDNSHLNCKMSQNVLLKRSDKLVWRETYKF